MTFFDSAHVGTLADKILLDPSREVKIVREVNEAHGEGPEVPLHNHFLAVFVVLSYKAAYSALG